MPPRDSDAGDARVEIQTSMSRATNYNRWIVDRARPHLGRRTLDAGCGTGNLAELLLPGSDLVVGVDEWPEMVRVAEDRLGATGRFRAIESQLTDPDLPGRLRELELDGAICANVLEHIDDDAAALRVLADSLSPGSAVVLLVPAFMALYGKHDELDHHVRRYTRATLTGAARTAGLDVRSIEYMNLPGFFAWFMLGRVLRRPLDDAAVSVYDRVVPAVRAAEARVRPPFGQSLFAVLGA